METQLNRIELRGVVGSSRVTEVGEARMARFTVATSYVFKAGDGTPVIETTWHTCVCREGTACADVSAIVKGRKVRLTGRLRNQRFTAADGEERTVCEVVVGGLDMLPDGEAFSFES